MTDVLEEPIVKPAFDPVKYLQVNLPRVPGTKMIIRPITGTSYRVNWYHPERNTIVKSAWVTVVEENGFAELIFPDKQ
jgi:hypothetical protein